MGTLGAVLVDPAGQQYGLSANHVLSRNDSITRLAGFSVIDAADAGSVVFRPVTIGNDVSCALLWDGCDADCAVVKAGPNVSFKQRLPDPHGTLTTEITEPVTGKRAVKFGSATQWTEGVIGDDVADIRLDCGPGLGVITITDVVLVRDTDEHDGIASFAAPGDSGALVFQQNDASGWSPFGMVVGGPVSDPRHPGETEDYIAVCRLTNVLKALNGVFFRDQSSSGSRFELAEFEVS